MTSNGPVGLMPPPDGVIPDFNVNHLTSTQHNFIAAYSITLFLAVVTLALRLYTRIAIIKGFGLDDGEFPSRRTILTTTDFPTSLDHTRICQSADQTLKAAYLILLRGCHWGSLVFP